MARTIPAVVGTLILTRLVAERHAAEMGADAQRDEPVLQVFDAQVVQKVAAAVKKSV